MRTRPRAGQDLLARLAAVPAAAWAKLAFGVICVVAAIGFVAVPTYPIYDSYYALLWGREALHLQHISFQVYAAPTEHPLSVAFGAFLSLFGQHADRLMIGATIASFVVLVAGLYRLSRIAFSPIVGAAAAALLLTRFNFSFLAVRGYVDIPYLAAITWAAALEAERPRRGAPVFGLLLLAELMRPEAWLLAGLYWLWYAWKGSNRDRVLYAVVVALGPLIWAGLDLAVTGDPMFSFHTTNDLAVTLGRNLSLSAIPGTLGHYLVTLDKAPLVVGAIAGLVLSLLLVPKRAVMPLVLALFGLVTFVVIGAAGLSVIDRYLLVPALMGLVFCAFALTGWTMLERGWMRRVWALCAALLTLYGIAVSASSLSIANIQTELGYRGDSHNALAAILRKKAVRAGLKCGAVSVPNRKLVPEARWILNRGPDGVIARSQARTDPAVAKQMQYGVALYPTGLAVSREALVDLNDNPLDQVPLAGFVRVAHTEYYGAYVRCP